MDNPSGTVGVRAYTGGAARGAATGEGVEVTSDVTTGVPMAGMLVEDEDSGMGAAAGDGRLEVADVGRLARRLVRRTVRAARADEGPRLEAMLREHLGAGVATRSVVRETWAAYEGVNVQAALDAWFAEPGRTYREIGFHTQYQEVSLSTLLVEDFDSPVRPAPVSRVNRPCGPDGETLSCVQEALYLVDEPGPDGARLALLVQATDERHGRSDYLIEIVSRTPGVAQAAAAWLRELSIERNVFRGHLLSFAQEMFGYGQSALTFHRRPSLTRDDVILDESVLAAIERQVVGVARHKTLLRAAGQHLKRGLLLYGPPGVGKTHTVRYLASVLTRTTIIQLSGEALGFISQACSVARALEPSVVVIEDVDLIAEDRMMAHGGQPLLFALLNEMDGLEGDRDVTFILTTNRADLLEPALAQRPGRVDQAVELTLPDLAARRRLFELYRGGLRIDADEAGLEALFEQAEGVTASFLKEWVRRAALVAAERTEPRGPVGERYVGERYDDEPAAPERRLSLDADDLRVALEDLLSTRNAMTRTLLGGRGAEEEP